MVGQFCRPEHHRQNHCRQSDSTQRRAPVLFPLQQGARSVTHHFTYHFSVVTGWPK